MSEITKKTKESMAENRYFPDQLHDMNAYIYVSLCQKTLYCTMRGPILPTESHLMRRGPLVVVLKKI